MALDACAAAPRAPHVRLHVQDTCRTPPLIPHVRMHAWSACKKPHQYTHVDQHVSVASRRRHLVLGRSTSCFYMSGSMYSFHAAVTPQASGDTQLVRCLTTPLPDHGVGLDGQSCSCLIVGWPVGLSSPTLGVGRPSVMFLFDCWLVGRPMPRTIRGCYTSATLVQV
uniref:Uncharacterized protein n=1 Tax=Brassica oleracea TaxID=3712 RepID=A0A3P6CDK7_BRAOL|nr:unnamed protein product [Brassica oleracea]